MDDYTRNKLLFEKNKNDDRKKHLEDSNRKLRNSCKTKITTTMIGALDAIEKALSKHVDDLNRLEWFGQLRSKILDLGNDQIRDMEDELAHYIVDFKKYTLRLKVQK